MSWLCYLLYFLWSRANNLEDCWMFSEFLHLVLLSSMCIDMVSLICSMLSYWLHFCWNFVVEVVIQNLYSFGMHVYKFLSQSFFFIFWFMISMQGKLYNTMSDMPTVGTIQTFRSLRMQIACILLSFFQSYEKKYRPEREASILTAYMASDISGIYLKISLSTLSNHCSFK